MIDRTDISRPDPLHPFNTIPNSWTKKADALSESEYLNI
jgi:hypothetical protein